LREPPSPKLTDLKQASSAGLDLRQGKERPESTTIGLTGSALAVYVWHPSHDRHTDKPSCLQCTATAIRTKKKMQAFEYGPKTRRKRLVRARHYGTMA
jgi:hypothetical protein